MASKEFYSHGRGTPPKGSTGEQRTKPKGSELPGSIMSKDTNAPGKATSVQAGHATDGSGRFSDPQHPNTGKVAHNAIHRPGTESKPSGRSISKG